MMDLSSELGASYYGFIGSTYDALILFEACITGLIKNVTRRPQERERRHVIQSGRVFMYEENTSGIKRWTDGISWSPSRILGNFLIYRQLLKTFGPGEKKRVIKKPKTRRPCIIKTSPRSDNSGNEGNILQNTNGILANGGNCGRTNIKKLEAEIALIGSLTGAYEFLDDGLVKKTISVIHGGATYHLVSYYTISDAINQELLVPSKDPKLAGIHPRASLITSQNFRNKVENVNLMERLVYPRNIHEMNSQTCSPSQITIMPNPGPCNSNCTTTDKVCTVSHTISMISSASEHGSSDCNSTIRHHTHHVSARGVCSAVQRSERCNNNDKVQFDTMATPNFSSCFALMRDAKTTKGMATIRDSQGLTGFSIMEGTNSDLNFRHDPSSIRKSSQKVFSTIGPIEVEGNLPCLMQVELGVHRAYEQKQLSVTHSNAMKFWRIGNASVGHGHYHNLSENKSSLPGKR